MNFPSKPWVNGQEAELVAGSNFVYDASKEAWVVNQDTMDSDIYAKIDNDVNTINAEVILIDGRVTVLESKHDSDHAVIVQRLADIEADHASDVTALEAADSALDARVTYLENAGDSDSIKIQAIQTELDALGTQGLDGIRTDMDSDRSDLISKIAEEAVARDAAIAQESLLTLQEIVDEENARIAAVNALSARIDSDYSLNNQKHSVQESLITANTNAINAIRVSTDNDSDDLRALTIRVEDLESNADSDVIDIARLRREADSDTLAIQGLSTQATATNLTIQTILAMLDSDGVNIQDIRTALEAEIAATNADVTNIEGRLDSDYAATNAKVATIESAAAALDTKVDANAASADSDNVVFGRQWNQATTPANPNANDFWYDTSTGKMFAYNLDQDVWIQVTY